MDLFHITLLINSYVHKIWWWKMYFLIQAGMVFNVSDTIYFSLIYFTALKKSEGCLKDYVY